MQRNAWKQNPIKCISYKNRTDHNNRPSITKRQWMPLPHLIFAGQFVCHILHDVVPLCDCSTSLCTVRRDWDGINSLRNEGGNHAKKLWLIRVLYSPLAKSARTRKINLIVAYVPPFVTMVWMVTEGKQKAVYEIGLVTIEPKRCTR